VSLVLKLNKALLIDWVTYVENILQLSFIGPFNVVGLGICLRCLHHNLACR